MKPKMPGYFDTIRRRRNSAQTITLAGRRRAPILSSNESLLAQAVEALLVWLERSRQRAALMRLDNARLGDIGIGRAEAEREYRKPFWRP